MITPGQRGDARVALALVGAVPTPKICIADTAYDSNGIRQMLIEDGALPVIPNNPTRKTPQPFDRKLYRLRNAIERMFCRLKDWRRLATRYDRLKRNFEAAVALAPLLCFWL